MLGFDVRHERMGPKAASALNLAVMKCHAEQALCSPQAFFLAIVGATA